MLFLSRRAILKVVALVWCSLTLCGCDDGIHTAASTCNPEKVGLLLRDNPNLVYSRNSFGWTALHSASISNCTDVAKLLLAYKADVDARENENGMTPLHYAAYAGPGYADYTDIAKLLLAHGADVNAEDDYGYTPLHHAAIHNHPAVAKLLLTNNADINAKDKAGATPLHYSADRHFRGMTELLLAHGADVNAEGDKGYTPLHYAELRRWWEDSQAIRNFAELLRQHGGHE